MGGDEWRSLSFVLGGWVIIWFYLDLVLSFLKDLFFGDFLDWWVFL